MAARGVDRRGLARALVDATNAEVRFSEGSRALYANDASVYRQVPIGVVIPRTVDDVVETVNACRELDAPILGRGTGTSLAGQGCNAAVIIDFSKHLNRILDVNPRKRIASSAFAFAWFRVSPPNSASSQMTPSGNSRAPRAFFPLRRMFSITWTWTASSPMGPRLRTSIA